MATNPNKTYNFPCVELKMNALGRKLLLRCNPSAVIVKKPQSCLESALQRSTANFKNMIFGKNRTSRAYMAQSSTHDNISIHDDGTSTVAQTFLSARLDAVFRKRRQEVSGYQRQCFSTHRGTLYFVVLCIAFFCTSFASANRIIAQSLPTSATPTPDARLRTSPLVRYAAIDAWTTENGLPHNAILDLIQTRDGYLWFGSFNGAVRFDGKNFRLLRRSNTPLFGSNTITTLLEDMRGNLWFGVQEGGVVCLQPDGTMIRLDSTFGFRDKMVRAWTENRIQTSAERGTVYLTCNKGIYAISADSLRNVFRIRRDSIYNLDTPEVSQDILLDQQGGFWAATRIGLYYRPSRTNPRDLRKFDTTNGLPNISAECLYEDRSGTVWVGTRRGVCRFTNGKCIQDSALQNTTPVHDFVEDRAGNLWIGTDRGLLLWTKSTAQPQLLNITSDDGLTDNSVRSILEDNEGNIWVGTYYGGLNRLKRGIFSSITPRDGLVNAIVYSALEARDGAMWVATFGGVQRITPRATTTFSAGKGLQSNIARALAEDSVGNIWVGTYGALHKISPEGRITAYTMKDGLVDDQVRSVCVGRDGTIWIGTVGGMSAFRNGTFTAYTAQNGGLPSNSMLGIVQDRQGTLWISTNGGGVMRLNPRTGAKSYLKPKIDLPSDDAFQVTESPFGDEVWIPCNGGFVMWKDGKSTMFTMRDGLPDENVFHIMEDAQGMLWMTCNIGIFSISKQNVLECAHNRTKLSGTNLPDTKLLCQLYTKSDGLQTNSCNVPSTFCATRSGEFWIPMQKGVAIINPLKAEKNHILPPVICESALADTTATFFNAKSRTVTVPAGTEHLEFRYTALSLSAPEQNEFRFMLEGIDKHWVLAETRRTAYYTNLPPGTYTFRVIAANNSGVWNMTGDAVTVVVKAYFYQTWWFYAACGLALIGAGFGAVRVRTWRLKARAAVLEKMVHDRTQQLEEHSEEIERQNQEIKRQLDILDHQAREIELVNSTLNEKNIHLVEANTTLEEANAEIYRQQRILESQAADIELANAELQERNAQLQALNQEKNEFLGIATHDLKNPLAAIRMTVSLVQKYYDRMTKEEVQDRLSAVETSSERMTSIITNLLDINAIESGKFNVSLENIEINDLALKMVDEYRERASAKNIVIHYSCSSAPIHAFADKNVVMEVLDNLISNAVKYSPHGRNVYVRLKTSTEAVHIEVQDEGPGLSEDDKSKLFGKFTRLSARPTAGEHSTGLGLSIVKRMVEAMNGRVWCESELSMGAMFCVDLPHSSPNTHA
jgi:signal transduction histidine kinase/ligand-binding sensor domain-containing protein